MFLGDPEGLGWSMLTPVGTLYLWVSLDGHGWPLLTVDDSDGFA